MKYLISDMTRGEFAERMQDDPVIIVPLGSMEQHGPMCPMGDFKITEALALAVAEATGSVCTPVLPFGHADYFQDVPGGISLSADTFKAVLLDLLINFLDHGFTRFLILNGHGGNRPYVAWATRKIRKERDVFIPTINQWASIPAEIWEKAHPDMGKKAFSHGGDPLGSLYLYLFADKVRTDLAVKWRGNKPHRNMEVAGLHSLVFQNNEVAMPFCIDDVNEMGMTGGDVTRSSADAGKVFFEYLVSFAGAFIKEYWKR